MIGFVIFTVLVFFLADIAFIVNAISERTKSTEEKVEDILRHLDSLGGTGK